jgi:L-lactate dehydrogenase complex protein LldG
MSGASSDSKERDKVMSAVRRALLVRGDEPGRRGMVRARLERTPSGPIPARAEKPKAELVANFKAMLEVQGAGVYELGHVNELPEAIASLLAMLNLPARLRHGVDPLFDDLPWSGLIERVEGAAQPEDLISLSRATAGAAETGTLFLTSGTDNPSTLNFLPETHCVVILAETIYGSFEEVWRGIREVYGKGKLPRTVNLVSGPSCTADIEQTIIRGAHGPRRLAVFIVSNTNPAN